MFKFLDRPLKLKHGVALVAVVAVLGGGAFAVAAIPGPDGTIKSCVRKSGSSRGSVRIVDHNRSCSGSERTVRWNQQGKRGAQGPRGQTGQVGLRGPGGASGATGPSGPSGQAAAFARVPAAGGVDTQTSQNKEVVAANVSHSANSGVYCFGGLGFQPVSAMVALDNSGAAASASETAGRTATVAVDRGLTPTPFTNCPAGFQQARVMVTQGDGGGATFDDHGFFVWFERP